LIHIAEKSTSSSPQERILIKFTFTWFWFVHKPTVSREVRDFFEFENPFNAKSAKLGET